MNKCIECTYELQARCCSAAKASDFEILMCVHPHATGSAFNATAAAATTTIMLHSLPFTACIFCHITLSPLAHAPRRFHASNGFTHHELVLSPASHTASRR